jgi:hypothetical protein
MPARIDYLRLGTWDAGDYSKIAVKINEHFITRPGHWLQYHGRRAKDGSAFHGTGSQGGRIHHICHISGDEAEEWAKHLKLAVPGDSVYCTRIDVQTTIERPKNYDSLEFYEQSKRVARSIVKNPETSTVYIGARTSDLFMRLYEKIINKFMYLRLEFELKGAYSRNWWSHWYSEPELVDQLFISCVNRIGLPEPYKSWFNPEEDETDCLNSEKLAADLAQKLTYLCNTETALVRYIYAHDTREHVVSLVERLVATISHLDSETKNH